MRQGIGLDADAGNSKPLALDEGRARAAEGVENGSTRPQTEPAQVVAHEVGWERQHEAIPFVCSAVLRPELIDIGFALSGGVCRRHVQLLLWGYVRDWADAVY